MQKHEHQYKMNKLNDWISYLEDNGITADLSLLEETYNKLDSVFSSQLAASNLFSAEPNDYDEIIKLAPPPPKVKPIPEDYKARLEGAVIARFVGCTLGVPVEGWSVEDMENFAAKAGMAFPPIDYWTAVTDPDSMHYGTNKRCEYTRACMDGVPTDDDIMYPLLNLLLVEKYGKDFTIEDVGRHWLDEMTICCTAEYEANEALKRGIPAQNAADYNPYIEWIGAEIRADLFGYICPGDPVKAAEMAYRDAYLTHRRTGIYGEMFIAAAIASAFTSDSIEDAFLDGLSVIPADSRLAGDIKWAMEIAPTLKCYKDASKILDEHFPGMHRIDTRNNTCAVIFALYIGKGDFTKTISECVAIGYDNDCTAATVGSIFGAHYGIEKIDKMWYNKFNNKIKCFLRHDKLFAIDDVLERIYRLGTN